MQLSPESESPATGKGRRADDSTTSFSGLTQRIKEYARSPFLASVSVQVVTCSSGSTDEQKARKLQAIDWIYRQKRKRRVRVTMPALRLRELEKIKAHWWSDQLPDDDDGRVFVRIVANHLIGLDGDPRERIGTWCNQFAPWLDEDEFDEIFELATISPTRFTADSIANAIGLDIETRDYLGLKTIGAYDFSKEDREQRRRAQHAARQRRKRVEHGATPRTQRVSQNQPWVTEGISRRTWYRRQKEARS